MKSKAIKFLFFIERELHLPMLANVMKYIYDNKIGEIGITGFPFQQSDINIPGRGVREEIISQYFDSPVSIIDDPYSYKPDITFMADFSYQFVEGLGKIVNIGHGTISKGWFFSENNISKRENCADLICVPGKIHKEILEKQVFKNIEITGMPKLDPLFTNEFSRIDILKKMNLNLNNKTVLIAPTFNEELSLIPYLQDNIRKYIPDYLNVIVKLHGAAPEDWKKRFTLMAQNNENFFYTEDLNIIECFVASDILISDISSVIYEFIALDKPVILFDSPTKTQYVNYNKNDLENRFRDVGYRFTDFSKLQELLFKSLINPKQSDKIKEISNDFISIKDGSSSRLVVENALKLLEKTETKTTIIIADENSSLNDNLLKKFQKYKIIIATNDLEKYNNNYDVIPLSLSKYENINNALKFLQTDNIIYYNAKFSPSPMFPEFLTAHFHYQKDCGLIFPLISNSDKINLQQLRFHVSMQNDTPQHLIGMQLTYSLPGSFKEIKYLDSVCFAFKKDFITQIEFSDITDEYLCNLEIFKANLLNGKKAILSLDTYIDHRPITPLSFGITRKSSFSMQPENIEEKTFSSQKNIFNSKLFNSIESTDNEIEHNNSDLIFSDDFFSANQHQEVDKMDELLQKLEENPSDTEIILEIIKESIERKNYDLVDVYTDMLPNNSEALYFASLSLEKQKFAKNALEKISIIDTSEISNRDLLKKILFLHGKLLMKNNQVADSKKYFDEALLIDDSDAELLINLGTYYIIQGDLLNAEKFYQQALSNDTSNLNAMNGIALVEDSKGNNEEAYRIYARILQQDQTNINALNGLLSCSYKTRDFDLIEKHLKKYTELYPTENSMLFVLTGVYFEQGKFNQALNSIDSVLINDHQFNGATELKEKILSKITPFL